MVELPKCVRHNIIWLHTTLISEMQTCSIENSANQYHSILHNNNPCKEFEAPKESVGTYAHNVHQAI